MLWHGVQTFFWDKLPQGRVAGTFWAAHPPDYGLLAASIPEAEELFQALCAIRHTGPRCHCGVLTRLCTTHDGTGAPRLSLHWTADGSNQ
jgi:hypothetical protein